MVIAEATTIHKAQGSSLKMVIVKLQKRMERSMIYVALSRVTTLEGLHIIGDFKAPDAPNEKHSPTNKMAEMRARNYLIPKFTHLRMIPSNILQIVSFNVQSLRKHINSICNDKIFTDSHMLLLQETWCINHETYEVPSMIEISRNSFIGRPAARGTIIFGKNDQDITPLGSSTYELNNQHIEISCCKISNLFIVNIYKNPASSTDLLKSVLKKIEAILKNDNVLLCADFNENLSIPNNSITKLFEDDYNFELLSPKLSTTDGNSTIDGVFGCLREYKIEVEIYESYFSYHKPLIIRLQKKEFECLSGISEQILRFNVQN